MKKIAILIVSVFALAAASTAGAKTTAVGTCAYRSTSLPQVSVALAVQPRAFTSLLCSSFNRGFQGRKVVLSPRLGQKYCAFGLHKASVDVVAVVFSTNARLGRAMCSALAPTFKRQGWVRLKLTV